MRRVGLSGIAVGGPSVAAHQIRNQTRRLVKRDQSGVDHQIIQQRVRHVGLEILLHVALPGGVFPQTKSPRFAFT